MTNVKSYIESIKDQIDRRDPNQTEFQEAVFTVLDSLAPILEAHPEYVKSNLLAQLVEPERAIQFRVPWQSDDGQFNVNRGFRVQFNSAIGPYKGGLRLHPSVNLSVVKFLGFEQILKNSLTGLPIGGAKGGSDFDPKGKSDSEIMRFCQSFMTELQRHIGPDLDVPAGDIGVGGREIGYLYGQYRRIKGCWENGVITGKGMSYGGSPFRPEATGYGAIYYTAEMLKHFGESVEGKTFAVSGFGNVAWGACMKIAELGGKAVTLGGPDGYIYDPEGIVTKEKFDMMLQLRASGKNIVKPYADKFGCEFIAGKKPWERKVDIALPCAFQNEINMEEAKKIVANGTKYYVEVANMPTTNEALAWLQTQCVVAPSKAVNAGGVACSALEMSQNSERLVWEPEEVDNKLKSIMKGIHDASAAAAEEAGLGYNLVAGANLAGFKKVADAMMAQGLI